MRRNNVDIFSLKMAQGMRKAKLSTKSTRHTRRKKALKSLKNKENFSSLFWENML